MTAYPLWVCVICLCLITCNLGWAQVQENTDRSDQIIAIFPSVLQLLSNVLSLESSEVKGSLVDDKNKIKKMGKHVPKKKTKVRTEATDDYYSPVDPDDNNEYYGGDGYYYDYYGYYYEYEGDDSVPSESNGDDDDSTNEGSLNNGTVPISVIRKAFLRGSIFISFSPFDLYSQTSFLHDRDPSQIMILSDQNDLPSENDVKSSSSLRDFIASRAAVFTFAFIVALLGLSIILFGGFSSSAKDLPTTSTPSQAILPPLKASVIDLREVSAQRS